MKILSLCNKMIYPPHDGGAIGNLNVLKAMAQLGNEVKVLVMNTPKHSYSMDLLPEQFKTNPKFYAVDVDTRIKPMGALLALLQNKSYNISRFINKEYEQKLIELLKTNDFDLIQLEGLYLCPYIGVIRKHTKAKISLRAHNIEHIIWERLSEKEPNPVKKLYLSILAKQLKSYEISQLSKVDMLSPVTQNDGEFLKALGWKGPMYACPAPYDAERFIADDSKMEPLSIFFLGGLDWMPNLEGLEWFIEKAWPIIHAKNPDVKFYIAGRNMPQNIASLNMPNVIVVPKVDDAVAYMNSKAVMISPLFSGSGMRVKIVEGMSLGKVIISTTIGAEGLPLTHNENILIADTPESFADITLRSLADEALFKKISSNALTFAQQNFEMHNVIQRLLHFYKTQLNEYA